MRTRTRVAHRQRECRQDHDQGNCHFRRSGVFIVLRLKREDRRLEKGFLFRMPDWHGEAGVPRQRVDAYVIEHSNSDDPLLFSKTKHV